MSHPSVREASAADLSALRAIQLVTLAEPWHELLSVAVDGPHRLLVYADPRPAGYALALDGDSEVYLVELAVAPPRQGGGVGSTLLSALAGRLGRDGYQRLRVTVRAVDERAVEFYLSRGFTRVATLSDHFESGDGYLLVRELDVPPAGE